MVQDCKQCILYTRKSISHFIHVVLVEKFHCWVVTHLAQAGHIPRFNYYAYVIWEEWCFILWGVQQHNHVIILCMMFVSFVCTVMHLFFSNLGFPVHPNLTDQIIYYVVMRFPLFLLRFIYVIRDCTILLVVIRFKLVFLKCIYLIRDYTIL